jgi:cytoskeletal protein CcmA (bactofilin family)
MFGKGKKSGCSRIDTIVGQNTRLEGDVRFSGGLHIDGKIKGNIIAEPGAEAVLTLSEQGSVEGDVRVPNLVLNGAVVGDVHVSERLEMASHAKVTGDVFYHLLEMAMGAEVNGSLVHRSEPQQRAKVDSLAETLQDHGAQTAGNT